jgi:hypothetical protein
MTVYIITRGYEVGDPYEQEWVTDIVGCTLSEENAEYWCDRAVEQEIYSDSEFNITGIELNKLPELPEEDEVEDKK